MSWFSQLTSRAEAMLVKLDQDAASALQNPDGILGGNKLIETITSTLDENDDNISKSYRDGSPEELGESFIQVDKTSNDGAVELSHNNNINETQISPQQSNSQNNLNNTNVDKSRNNNHQTTRPLQSQHETQPKESNVVPVNDGDRIETIDTIQHVNVPQASGSGQTNFHETPRSFPQQQNNPATIKPDRYSNKFVIQTSKTKIFNSNNANKVPKNANNNYKSRVQTTPKVELKGVDDIRDSIRKSLQEYVSQPVQETSYSSHFDSQPNMIYDNHSPNDSYRPTGLHSSPSFSIELPDQDQRSEFGGSSTSDVAMKLLQQSAMKKKSTFYLHKVINKLASPYGQSNNGSIISGEMKIKLRRYQMRVGSYARRLNYYYRTNPMMKYMIIVYLILMQILVVYVLFFYQSSSSSSTDMNDLPSQIKKQQQELNNR